jgi:Lon protease-like protein
MNLSVFPLNAIVCPKGRVSLRIFELRYLDMVRACLRQEEPFVVTLVSPHKKHGQEFYTTGTMVKIVDFGGELQNGMLNIIVEGVVQVGLSQLSRQEDGLWKAEIIEKDQQPYVTTPEEFDDLCLVLKALVKHPYVQELAMDIDYEDAREVGWRLTELLPLGNEQKQCLYEMDSAELRLSKIADQLSDLVE